MGVAMERVMRRPTELRLRRAFADVLTALVATTAGATALGAISGCSGATVTEPTGGGGSTPHFTTLCGTKGGTPYKTLLQGMHPSPQIDGAVNRTESAFNVLTGPGGVTGNGPDVVGDDWKSSNSVAVGTLCATAKDPAACNAKVAGYRILPVARAACVATYPAQYATNACSTTYILTTRGDEIAVARTNDEVKTLLGTFDTLEEALWVTENASTPYQVSCGQRAQSGETFPDSEYRTTADGGWDLKLLQYQNCGQQVTSAVVHVDYAGTLSVVSADVLPGKPMCAVAGRRPAGLSTADASPETARAIGAHFAQMATLEAASVVAFRRLARQLAAMGAPSELLARVRRAAHDEVRHARAISALAREHGVTRAAPRVAPARAVTPFELAVENAREGCVRETFGALVAHFQKTRAASSDVRDCMAAIADEETEHAALSWDLASWLDTRLTDEERARVAAERRAAFNELACALEVPVSAEIEHIAGFPSPREARRLLDGLAPVMLAA